MAQYTTSDSVGVVEDVSDVITNLSPTRTPFSAALGTEKMTQRKKEWQEDDLAAVGDNAQVEGFTAVFETLVPTRMRENIAQLMAKAFDISVDLDTQKNYGREREIAYQTAKKGLEIKRDLEHTYVGLNQAALNAPKGTASRMASAIQMIDADNIVAGAGANLSEDMVLEAAQNAFDNGADPSILMVTSANSKLVAAFSGMAERTRDVNASGGRKITFAVDTYVTPFGIELKVTINRWLKADTTLLLDPEQWKMLVRRPWSRQDLAKVGDSERKMIVGSYSLKHANFKASAAITGTKVA